MIKCVRPRALDVGGGYTGATAKADGGGGGGRHLAHQLLRRQPPGTICTIFAMAIQYLLNI